MNQLTSTFLSIHVVLTLAKDKLLYIEIGTSTLDEQVLQINPVLGLIQQKTEKINVPPHFMYFNVAFKLVQ